MTGQACANQAFRVGRATYGFQCHFEATPDIIKSWVDLFGPSMERRLGDRAAPTLKQLERDRQGRAAAQRAFAEAVTDRWAALAR
jgi:GMP synthase (glutamine-hydrolysing)